MAGSIKFLSFNQKFSYVVGIHPPQSNQNDQPTFNSRNWIIIISSVLLALSSVAFFVFDAKSMLEYGISFFSASAALFMMSVHLVIIWQIKNSGPFIENCERFIEKRENSIATYRAMIEKIERLCKLIGIAMILTILFMTLPFLLYSLVNYYIFDLGAESFFLLFPQKWPFDWKTPQGYFVTWFIESAGCAAMKLTCIIFLNFVFGSCWLFIFMAEDITKDLAAFNIDVKRNKNRPEWRNRFCDIVQLYSDASGCVSKFNAVVKYSLFILNFFLMLSVSSILLTLQFQSVEYRTRNKLDENANKFETFVVSILGLWVFGDLFFICELGERIAYRFDMFREELEQCDWHTLSIEMKRIYLIFLLDTQQSKNIACYGNVLCTRETFKKMINKGCSYFIALRHFEA